MFELKVSKMVGKILDSSRTCLVLGGDHSIATGSIHGHLKVAGGLLYTRCAS